jgi:hypothetical protein
VSALLLIPEAGPQIIDSIGNIGISNIAHCE